MTQMQTFFITCPKGVEDLLAVECEQQGLSAVAIQRGGVDAQGGLENAYRLCLWSRVASRVLFRLHAFAVDDYEALYQGVQAIDWQAHVAPDGSFAIDVHSSHERISNSHYARLKIKDAIADQFVNAFKQRPDVERDRPAIRVNAYIDKHQCTLYLDLSGESLHKRGYRQQAGAAPLKENLAAAILLRAQWPQLALEHRPLIDPLCGSATLLIEAALIAADKAPGLLRDYYGFYHWKRHRPDIWERLVDQAQARVSAERVPRLIGIEKSYKVAGIARENIRAAGFEGLIEIKQADSIALVSDLAETPGLIVTNPPYGKRISDDNRLKRLYYELGRNVRQGFPGWRFALFTAHHQLAKLTGLRAHRRNTLYNGPIKCTLYQYRIRERETSAAHADDAFTRTPSDPGVDMFANRLAKNLKHLSKWSRKEGIGCYRLYDADIPQYAVAVDLYQDWVHVQEYQAPDSVDAVKAFARLNQVIEAVSSVLNIGKDRIVQKTRKRHRGKSQYARQSESGKSLIVTESGLKFSVNLNDYLDTGLFLDHRLTRQLIAKLAANKTFLNLFAYTGAATVYAAAGGASVTTTVDLSKTYLDWAKKNMQLNRLTGTRHSFVRADCIQWLADAGKRDQRYDLIFLDPPTFSNSKRMDHTLDIRRDHVELIRQAMSLLAGDGLLLFSTNARGFKLDTESLRAYAMRDITGITTSEDFRRKPAHVCWCLANDPGDLKKCRL